MKLIPQISLILCNFLLDITQSTTKMNEPESTEVIVTDYSTLSYNSTTLDDELSENVTANMAAMTGNMETVAGTMEQSLAGNMSVNFTMPADMLFGQVCLKIFREMPFGYQKDTFS